MQIVPTPARARRDAIAEPVAPHPTIAIREAISLRCPSAPIPGKSTCLEYLSSIPACKLGSKEVINFAPVNRYYRVRPVGQCQCNNAEHAVIEPIKRPCAY